MCYQQNSVDESAQDFGPEVAVAVPFVGPPLRDHARDLKIRKWNFNKILRYVKKILFYGNVVCKFFIQLNLTKI